MWQFLGYLCGAVHQNLRKRQQFTKMISLSSSSFSLYKSNGKSEKNVTRCDNNVANIYPFKLNNRNTRKRFEICPKSTIKTRFIPIFLLLVLNIFHTFFLCLCCGLWVSNTAALKLFKRKKLLWNNFRSNRCSEKSHKIYKKITGWVSVKHLRWSF